MWLFGGGAQPEPEPEPREDAPPPWREVAAAASATQAADPAAAADVIRGVLQTQGDAKAVRQEQGRLRCALGFALGAGGDYAAAAAEFSAVQHLAEAGRQPGSVHPKDAASVVPHARYGLGVCELARDKPSAAVAELQACVDAGAADGQALLALGLALLQSGRAGEAVAQLEAAVKAERDFDRAKEAVAVLAEAYRGAGKIQEAKTRYGHVIEMGGRVARVASGHRGLGLAALQEGGPEQLAAAAEHFMQSVAVMSDGDSPDAAAAQAMAHRLHALVLRRQGLWEDSSTAFRSAIDCDTTIKNLAAAQLGLALSLWRGGDVNAAREACTIICSSDDVPAYLKSRARGLLAGLAAACSDAPMALELALVQPSSAGSADETASHAVAAWSHRKQGNVAQIVRSYESAMRCFQQTPSTSKELAKDLFGAPPEAVLELLLGQAVLACAHAGVVGEEAAGLELDPDLACDRIERALILTEGGEGSRASAIATAACRELGLHAGFNGRYSEAAEHLEHAVELNPRDAEAQFQLATALGYIDQADRSDEHSRIAMELRADTPAPEPDEQARLVATELIIAVEEAQSYFAEVTAARRTALAELPTLPATLWTRLGLF